MNTTEGSTVSFYCRIEGALAIIWHVNETVVHQLPRVLRTAINYSEGNSNRVFYLNVTAQPIINNSRIVCIGIFADRRIYSDPTLLLIQGKVTAYCLLYIISESPIYYIGVSYILYRSLLYIMSPIYYIGDSYILYRSLLYIILESPIYYLLFILKKSQSYQNVLGASYISI